MIPSPELAAYAKTLGVKFIQDVNHDGQLTKSDVHGTQKILVEKGILKAEPAKA